MLLNYLDLQAQDIDHTIQQWVLQCKDTKDMDPQFQTGQMALNKGAPKMAKYLPRASKSPSLRNNPQVLAIVQDIDLNPGPAT